MAYRRVFKPSLTKRILAWSIILICAPSLIAVLMWAVQDGLDHELGGKLGIGGFLLFLVLCGMVLRRSYYVLTDKPHYTDDAGKQRDPLLRGSKA